jgi:sugar/nucleoside kinase (ribokinase family)
MLDTHGDLHASIADMEVLREIPVPSHTVLEKARFLVIDANPPLEKMIDAAKLAVHLGVSVFFEPTSVPKAKAACRSYDFVSCLTFASPNAEELIAMAYSDDKVPLKFDGFDAFNSSIIRDAATTVLKRMMSPAYLIVTLGVHGVLFGTKDGDLPDGKIVFTHFPAQRANIVANTTGGGDSLVGAFLTALIDGKDHHDSILYGQKVAVQCISHQKSAISPFIKKVSDF